MVSTSSFFFSANIPMAGSLILYSDDRPVSRLTISQCISTIAEHIEVARLAAFGLEGGEALQGA
jgi:hypothetical protein